MICVPYNVNAVVINRSLKSKEVTTIGPLKLETQKQEQGGDPIKSKQRDVKQELLYNFSHWGR